MGHEAVSNILEDHKKLWADGISHELAFWDDVILGKSVYSKRLEDFSTREKGWEFDELVSDFAVRVIFALDVGSGPVSIVGRKSEKFFVNLIAVDPLADEYAKRMSSAGLPNRTFPFAIPAEDLSIHFPAETFHFVWSANALDHAYDLRRAFNSILTVMKTGATFILHSAEREGSRGGWGGLHQWDFVPLRSEGDLLVESRLGERFSIKQVFGDAISIRHIDVGEPHTFQLWLKKLAPL